MARGVHYSGYASIWNEIMDIKTEQDITPEAARHLRKRAGLTQLEFWESVGSTQGSGQFFETGKRKGIPKPMRILIFLRYVAQIDLNVSDPREADAVVKLGRAMHAKKEAFRAKLAAQQAEQEAKALAAKADRLTK